MKKFLVIGNPIDHSLSPKLQNYWIKQNNLNAIYDKKLLNKGDIEGIIKELRNDNISGINVTVPFKKLVIPFLNKLTPLAEKTDSVNTIYKKKDQIIGDNTDAVGFELALKHINYNVKGKKAFIIGAGGVAPSIISALKKMDVSDITLSNRTREKAEVLKKKFSDLKVINWGDTMNSDIIINATSLGLKENDEIKLDYSKTGSNKLFYDVIYSPSKTKFLLNAEQLGNRTENGKMMFAYQAQLAFKIWHNIEPKIDNNVIKLLGND